MKTGTTSAGGRAVHLVVDTCVWSLVLRRDAVDPGNPWVKSFVHHVEVGDAVVLLGPILQELLDGVRSERDFDRLLRTLEPFPVIGPARSTYVEAARLGNLCRTRGVQAGPADFFIAASCIERGFPLLTSDRDFSFISRHCDLILLPSVP